MMPVRALLIAALAAPALGLWKEPSEAIQPVATAAEALEANNTNFKAAIQLSTDPPTEYGGPTATFTLSPSSQPTEQPTDFPTLQPTEFPTLEPTLEPTFVERAADNTTEGGLLCFPGSALVELPGRVMRSMDQLTIGDVVRTSTGFSDIVAFGHRSAEKSGVYIQLETASGNTLELSANHLVFKGANREPVFASEVVVGDSLWLAEAATAAFVQTLVEAIHTVSRNGVFAPITRDGTVAVNNILASSYTLPSFKFPFGYEVTGQWASQYAYAPLRLACAVSKAACTSESAYDQDGQHVYNTALNMAFKRFEAKVDGKTTTSILSTAASSPVALMTLLMTAPFAVVCILSELALQPTTWYAAAVLATFTASKSLRA